MPNLGPITMRRQPPARNDDWCRVENKAKDKTAKVYIYDEIGFWGTTAAEFAQQLNELDVNEIELHVNSPGGQVFDGIAIYNALKQHPAKVTTYVDALAASAASFIALAGDKVIMSRNATMMIHDAMGICMGNSADMIETSKILDSVSDNIADIYAFNAGGEASDWRDFMRAETWYTAFEARDAGLADEVADDEDKDAEEATNKWDLSVFNHAGRSYAPSPALVKHSILNRVKEAQMGKTAPTNTDGTQTPAEPTTPSSDPAPESTPPSTEPAPAPETPATNPPPGDTPTNKATSPAFVINGQTVTDFTAVQAHISNLETFRRETIEASRIEFVENMARSGKIAATQVGNKAESDKPATGLIGFAMSLTDEQFASWRASMDAQPASSLFQQHGIEPGDELRPHNQATPDDVAAEIANLEQIVADHRRTGMPQAKIEEKESWKRLQALKSSQTKS